MLAKHGRGVREIAREVGVSRNTVRRYLRDPEAARYRARPPRPGKLAAFEGYIAERIASAAPERLEATVLLRELRERGYAVTLDGNIEDLHRRVMRGGYRAKPSRRQ